MIELSERLKNARLIIPRCKFSCKQNCFECCTSINLSNEEKTRMQLVLEKQGLKSPPNGKGEEHCEYLTQEGQCSVYEERPIICRMFGVMRTPFLCCSHNVVIQMSNLEAPDEFPKEIFDYMEVMFKDGGTNKNGQQIRNGLEPLEKALLEGPKAIVALADIYLQAMKVNAGKQEQIESILVELEKAMLLAGDSLCNYFSGISFE